MNLLTTAQASEQLGVSVSRVQKLIWSGRLPAQKLGRDYFISESDLALVADRRPGRPPKPEKEKAAKTRAKKGGRK